MPNVNEMRLESTGASYCNFGLQLDRAKGKFQWQVDYFLEMVTSGQMKMVSVDEISGFFNGKLIKIV